MRKVKFKKWIPVQTSKATNGNYVKVAGTECWSEDFMQDGIFHQWGSAIEKTDNGVGTYTVAIVEIADGTILEVLPSNIKFI